MCGNIVPKSIKPEIIHGICSYFISSGLVNIFQETRIELLNQAIREISSRLTFEEMAHKFEILVYLMCELQSKLELNLPANLIKRFLDHIWISEPNLNSITSNELVRHSKFDIDVII